MSNLSTRIQSLHRLGQRLLQDTAERQQAIQQAYIHNPWFTPESTLTAINGIVANYLSETSLVKWLDNYTINYDAPKVIGLVLAGNIPLVGFHDILCVYLSGNSAQLKLSSKDSVLMHYVLGLLNEIDPATVEQIKIVERLTDFDAVIATGSNNSSRYFEQYFGRVPHIIRKNRNAIAILTDQETDEDFFQLGKDIFTYFGLGCRNVSKLYVPDDYDFTSLIETLHSTYGEIIHHNKYKNNYDYNHALFMLNKEQFLMSESLLLKRAEPIPSRIASVHYETYTNINALVDDVKSKSDEIQCIVSGQDIEGLDTFRFGKAQEPGLEDYADGVDTLAFLVAL